MKARMLFAILLTTLMTSNTTFADDMNDLLILKQKDMAEEKSNEKDEYAEKQKLRSKISEIFAGVVKSAYLDMKNGGVDFGNATSLYLKLQSNLRSNYDFDYLQNVVGDNLIKFNSSWALLNSVWYDGAFTVANSGKLFSIDGDYVWDSDPCRVKMVVDAYFPGAGFEAGGATQRAHDYSCEEILSRKADNKVAEDIKEFVYDLM